MVQIIQAAEVLLTNTGGAYIGGAFTLVDNKYANRVAKWNGSAWSSLGDNTVPAGNGADGFVFALAVSGTNVYVGGSFSTVHTADFVDVSAAHIARWNGSAWSALGSGTDGGVYALATASNKVYAAGHFANAGGNPATNIAQWNGSAWSPLGSGLQPFDNDIVEELAGDGRGVYAGGTFTSAGNKPSHNLAYWYELTHALYVPLLQR